MLDILEQQYGAIAIPPSRLAIYPDAPLEAVIDHMVLVRGYTLGQPQLADGGTFHTDLLYLGINPTLVLNGKLGSAYDSYMASQPS